MTGPGWQAGAVATTRPRARKGQSELREQILDMTERLLVELGSEEAVSIRVVADAVGVTPPAIYRHFADKADLVFEVCARHFAQFDEVIAEAVEGVDDPVDVLRRMGTAYVRFGLEHPEHYRIMFMAPAWYTPEKWENILNTGAFAQLIQRIEAIIDAGLMRPGADAFSVALHTWANIHGLTSLLVARPSIPWPDLDQLIDEHLDICLRAHLA